MINIDGNCLLFNLGFRDCCIRCLNDVANAIDNLRKFYKVRTKTIFKKIIKKDYYPSAFFTYILISLFSTSKIHSIVSPALTSKLSATFLGTPTFNDLELGLA